MALLAGISMDGCGTYTTEQDVLDAGWTKTGTITPVLNDGRILGGSLHLGIGDQMARTVAMSSTDFFLQFHMYLTAYADASERTLVEFRNNSGADQAGRITMDTTGVVRIYDASNTEVDNSAAAAVSLNEWNTWEIFIRPAPTGFLTVKVNNTNIVSVDEDYSITAIDVDLFRISGVQQNTRFDDIIWNDNSGSSNNGFLGDKVIYELQPEADGTDSEWTQNGAGTDHGCIGSATGDVIPGTHDSDTTYLSATGTDPLATTVDVADLPPGVANIIGVQVRTAMRKDDANPLPGGSRLRTMLRHSGTVEIATTDMTVAEGYTPHFDTFEDVPGGSGWTVNQISDLEIGVSYQQNA